MAPRGKPSQPVPKQHRPKGSPTYRGGIPAEKGPKTHLPDKAVTHGAPPVRKLPAQ